MKKFKFRLESVLRYRKIIQELQEARVITARDACRVLEDKIEALDEVQSQAYKAMIDNVSSGFNLADLQNKETYIERIVYDKSMENIRLAKRKKSLQFEEIRYTKLAQEHKVVEKLKTKAHELYRKDVLDEELKTIDDLVNTRFRALND